ncbi:MAG: 50S ribosomal protein L24 [bacterium]|nr:50S ribosomal protein L24 [bacterium]
MRIKKGDTIKILSGKDKEKNGKVMSIDFKNDTAIVEGLNLFKKHRRPTKQGEKGEIITVPRPIATSKLMLVCGRCGQAARVGHRLEGENKIRYCKKCQSET